MPPAGGFFLSATPRNASIHQPSRCHVLIRVRDPWKIIEHSLVSGQSNVLIPPTPIEDHYVEKSQH
jgi:hypothetical protein